MHTAKGPTTSPTAPVRSSGPGDGVLGRAWPVLAALLIGVAAASLGWALWTRPPESGNGPLAGALLPAAATYAASAPEAAAAGSDGGAAGAGTPSDDALARLNARLEGLEQRLIELRVVTEQATQAVAALNATLLRQGVPGVGDVPPPGLGEAAEGAAAGMGQDATAPAATMSAMPPPVPGTAPGTAPGAGAPAVSGAVVSPPPQGVPAAAGGAPTLAVRINVNTAGAAELDLLPGIGPALAQRIIESRTATGPFRSLADLGRVSGIGDKTLEKLAPHVRFE